MNGTRDLVVQLKGRAPATVVHTMPQPGLNEARLAARTCTRASLDNEKANSKGKVRVECAAAIHFMWNMGWEKVMDAYMPTTPQCEGASSRRKKLGVDVQNMVGEFCKHASTCVFAWHSARFSGADLGRLGAIA